MVETLVPLRGSGTVQLPAYGVADAEHQVEKEILRRLPDARVTILGVSRGGEAPRIVEEFSVRYRLQLSVAVTVEDTATAAAEARRAARAALIGTRYAATAWEPTTPETR